MATGKTTEVNGLLMWRWCGGDGKLYTLHQLRAAGVILEPSITNVAEELVGAADAMLATVATRESKKAQKASLRGMRLQLPLSLEIDTAEGVPREGILIAGDFEKMKLQVQIGNDVMSVSKAAKIATGRTTELNGMLMWKWRANGGRLFSLHQLREVGVILEEQQQPPPQPQPTRVVKRKQPQPQPQPRRVIGADVVTAGEVIGMDEAAVTEEEDEGRGEV